MASPRNPARITTPTILAVEGNDDFEFLGALIRHLKLDTQITVWILGDKFPSSIRSEVEILLQIQPDGIDQLKCIGILLDADDDDGISLKNIQVALAELGLPVPQAFNQPMTDKEPIRGEPITIIAAALPVNLETLLMRVLDNDPVIKCAIDFLDCTQEASVPLKPRYVAKATFHAYLEAKANSKGKPISGIRDLPQLKSWSWEHPLLDEIKAFVRQVATLA